MFKNLIDSFLIIDAKDKPAPSFLTAYVFTWLVWHNDTTLAFFKTTGGFTTRFNASINITTENQWIVVLLLTFVLVVLRFAVNNIIYYAREFIDSKTQARLNKKGHKSFISNEIFQKQNVKISSLQSDLLSSQDREKVAKKDENEATSTHLDLTIDRDKYKGQFETQLEKYNGMHNKIVNYSKQKEQDNTTIESLKAEVKEHLESICDAIKTRDFYESQVDSIGRIIDIWSVNSKNNDLKSILVSRDSLSETEKDSLSKVVNSTIIYQDMNRKEYDEMLSKIKITDSVPIKGHGQKIGTVLSKFSS